MTGLAQVVAVLNDDVLALATNDISLVGDITDSFLKEPEPESLATVYLPNLGVAIGHVDNAAADQLDASTGIDMYAATQIGSASSVAARAHVPIAEPTWGINRIGIPGLWREGLTGEGVAIGHLDTGVHASHPDLDGKVAGFAEFDLEGNRVPGVSPHDSAHHGTHTAGILCGGDPGRPTIGIAPGARLFSGLVIEGGKTLIRMLRGMEWLLEETNVRIMSSSVGFRGFVGLLQPVVQRIRDRGVLPVFPIGNDGPNSSRSPGNQINSLSVGSTDSENSVARYSSSVTFDRREEPRKPDVVAPGSDVVSAVPAGYREMKGTSMAAAHVAGLAALLLEGEPRATVDELDEAIRSSAQPLTDESPLRFGKGLVNAAASLEALEAM